MSSDTFHSPGLQSGPSQSWNLLPEASGAKSERKHHLSLLFSFSICRFHTAPTGSSLRGEKKYKHSYNPYCCTVVECLPFFFISACCWHTPAELPPSSLPPAFVRNCSNAGFSRFVWSEGNKVSLHVSGCRGGVLGS